MIIIAFFTNYVKMQVRNLVLSKLHTSCPVPEIPFHNIFPPDHCPNASWTARVTAISKRFAALSQVWAALSGTGDSQEFSELLQRQNCPLCFSSNTRMRFSQNML